MGQRRHVGRIPGQLFLLPSSGDCTRPVEKGHQPVERCRGISDALARLHQGWQRHAQVGCLAQRFLHQFPGQRLAWAVHGLSLWAALTAGPAPSTLATRQRIAQVRASPVEFNKQANPLGQCEFARPSEPSGKRSMVVLHRCWRTGWPAERASVLRGWRSRRSTCRARRPRSALEQKFACHDGNTYLALQIDKGMRVGCPTIHLIVITYVSSTDSDLAVRRQQEALDTASRGLAWLRTRQEAGLQPLPGGGCGAAPGPRSRPHPAGPPGGCVHRPAAT